MLFIVDQHILHFEWVFFLVVTHDRVTAFNCKSRTFRLALKKSSMNQV
jgi:hypothetical protein